MSYGTRSFAVSVAAPPTPVVRRPPVRRAVAVLKGTPYGPPVPWRLLPSPNGRVARIIAEAAAQHSVTYWGVCGPSQKKRFVRARWLALMRLREAYPMRGLIWLGRQVNRDHTTVLFALRRVAENPDRVTSAGAMALSRDEADAAARLAERREQRRLWREETIREMEATRSRRTKEREVRAAALAERRQCNADRAAQGKIALPGSKIFDESKVRRIKALMRKGLDDAEIALRFATTRSNIWKIRHRKTWKHVT